MFPRRALFCVALRPGRKTIRPIADGNNVTVYNDSVMLSKERLYRSPTPQRDTFKGSRKYFVCKIFAGEGETDVKVLPFLFLKKADGMSCFDAR